MNYKIRIVLIFLIVVIFTGILLDVQITPGSHHVVGGRSYTLEIDQGQWRVTFFFTTPRQLGVGVYWKKIFMFLDSGVALYGSSVGSIQFHARTLTPNTCPYLLVFDNRLGVFFNSQDRC